MAFPFVAIYCLDAAVIYCFILQRKASGKNGSRRLLVEFSNLNFKFLVPRFHLEPEDSMGRHSLIQFNLESFTMTNTSLSILSLDLLSRRVKDKCRRRRWKELERRSEERKHRLSEISKRNRRLSEQLEVKKKKAAPRGSDRE